MYAGIEGSDETELFFASSSEPSLHDGLNQYYEHRKSWVHVRLGRTSNRTIVPTKVTKV